MPGQKQLSRKAGRPGEDRAGQEQGSRVRGPRVEGRESRNGRERSEYAGHREQQRGRYCTDWPAQGWVLSGRAGQGRTGRVKEVGVSSVRSPVRRRRMQAAGARLVWAPAVASARRLRISQARGAGEGEGHGG